VPGLHASSVAPATDRGEALLSWYRTNGRDLPWRGSSDPYRILVSEVMLQQTQVARVVPTYEAFIERFPTVESLADSPLAEVVAAWRGLGYNTRARRLRDAARMVADEGWPTTAEGLRRLPGVGPYTSAAVACFAFGEQVPAVDTNHRRVLSRWAGRALSGGDLDAAAAAEVHGDAAAWNQAVMDLGAALCRPRQPVCGDCPVSAWCRDPSVYQPPPRQQPFSGSDREVRGAVLRGLDGSTRRTPESLAEETGHPHRRIEAAIAALERDGMVEVESDGVRLAR
jgi:A/G-specific adenine glycosylase